MSKKIEKTVSLESFEWNELDENIQDLVEQARLSALKAYAPYSKFHVGAALLLDNGKLLSANNQENASFPVGNCAERVVLGFAHANHPEAKPLKLAIAARKGDEKKPVSVTPCGFCRQTITEYEQRYGQTIEIFMLAADGSVLKAAGIDELLPFGFKDLNG
ncbi:cytidine deaminase [Litoribacter ruber]|uniref:cytidine deaminase n=1 Tax=Litoribacter ruber TaxID=702568 RepID=UPI001BDA8D89|nr:cytidine deaminase [Litoribacter ruber]MBT0812807.1 cytidine deaminase [Litoribacter ruber]